MIYISINYSEDNPKSYNAVVLSIDNEVQTFSTGDFIKDWYYAMKMIIESPIEFPILYSSSIYHFISDTNKYKSAYLTFVDDKSVLSYKYIDNSKNIEFFVQENETPTWEELKNYCK